MSEELCCGEFYDKEGNQWLCFPWNKCPVCEEKDRKCDLGEQEKKYA